MSKRDNQKGRLLALQEILERNTDEDHLMSVPDMVKALADEGIEAERKCIYTDLRALEDSGVDVHLNRGRNGGYYIGDRTFQLAELKLLVDAVQSSQFITKKKTDELVKKLEGFASNHQAGQMRRQLVTGRIKAPNESIYFSVDALHAAIAQNKQVTFQYMEWSLTKTRVAKRGGEKYVVSPWALAWSDSNYYLIAYAEGGIRHYRVDKMKGVELTEEPRQGRQVFSELDMSKYIGSVFGMFGGKFEQVTLRCRNDLVNSMIDRFGTGVILVEQGNGSFDMRVRVQLSPQFYGWVCGFGSGIEVMEPAYVREKMKELVGELAQKYNN